MQGSWRATFREIYAVILDGTAPVRQGHDSLPGHKEAQGPQEPGLCLPDQFFQVDVFTVMQGPGFLHLV